MKVSKLFHWLYALLMLLPAFFVGGRMAYTIFNKNAKDSYSGESGDSNVFLDNLNQMRFNNEYHFLGGTFDNDVVFNTGNRIYAISLTYEDVDYENVYFSFYKTSGIQYSYFYLYNSTDNTAIFQTLRADNITFSYVFRETNFTNEYFSYFNNKFYYIYHNTSGTLDNAFDYSMNQINELPLFSWAKDSFLVRPFSYIGNLFGLPAESPIITLLSYWLSISIIYLVFDLIMYVPLLAHRWIDKGMIE